MSLAGLVKVVISYLLLGVFFISETTLMAQKFNKVIPTLYITII
jgi:hypothetical protein